jgi:PhnB protein
MLADEHPEMNIRGPKALGGSPVTLHVQVDDVDAVAARAVAAGATVVFPVKDQFYGERSGRFEDRSATSGSSRRTWRTYRPRNCSGATTTT